MSRKMAIIRKAIVLSKKSESNAIESSKKKKQKPIKDIVAKNDYFRGVNQLLEKLIVKNTYHNIVEIAGRKCHKLGINRNKKYFSTTEYDKNKIIIYIHGGGFCRGFPLHGVFYVKAMMKRLGCDALAPDYSLSPEVKYPTALEELVCFYKEVLKEYKPENIILTGESAGANLALALAMRLRDEKVSLPKCLVLISGFFDLNNDKPSYEINKDTDVSLTKEILDLMAQTYVYGDYGDIPSELCKDQYISPVYGNFKDLPPIMFTVCSDELLYDDTAACYAKAKKAGNDCFLYVDKNCFHAYVVMGDVCTESKKACNEIEKFVKEQFEK